MKLKIINYRGYKIEKYDDRDTYSVTKDGEVYKYNVSSVDACKYYIDNLNEDGMPSSPEIKNGLYTFGMYLYYNKMIPLKKSTSKDYQMVAYDFLKDEYQTFIQENGYKQDCIGMWYEGCLKELFTEETKS